MGNTIQYAQVLQSALDTVAVQGMLTGWMDRNAGKVKYSGGKEVKIPQLSTDGLGDYDRGSAGGYAGGEIKLEYKTKEMTQDRGRKFSLDAMKVDGDKNVEYSYTPASSTIINRIKKGIMVIRENGYNGQLMIHISGAAKLTIEEKVLDKLASVSFSQGGIDTKVPAIDGCPLIETPQNRMYSHIKLNDGVTEGQKQGGYVKADTAIEANFIIAPADIPIAVTKQDLMRIFDPATNQNANAWSMDYRRYHDIWVLDNKSNSIYASFKGAKPSLLSKESKE